MNTAAPPEQVNTDARAASRLGWLIVLFGAGGFLLWAFLAPLDKGVPLAGTLAMEGSRKAIGHPAGGRVEAILARDGDVVAAGQVLVRFDKVQARAQAEMSRGLYFAARALEARLLAERDGAAVLASPALPALQRADPRLVRAMALQGQLLRSRQASLRSELGAIAEGIAGLTLQAQGLQAARDSKQDQLALLGEQLANLRALAGDGYVSRNHLLDMERQHAQLKGELAEDGGNLGRLRRQAAELALRAAQRRQDYQNEVSTQLADAQREAGALASRLAAHEHELGALEVRAPVAGTVVALAVFAPGAVVAPGARMMEIVPAGDALVVEGQLPVHLVDKVRPGLPVELAFPAFNTNRTPHVGAEVTQVAADRSVDERSGMPYYKVRVRLTAQGQRMVAAHRLALRPGMPVDLFVKTGERTMMSYLLKPVFDRMGSAMGEE